MGRFPRTPRTRCWYVHASVYGSWNRLCFCPVFHGTRAAPSTTGVGNFFSRVPVRPVLGTCTGPCTDRGIICAFAMFSMAHIQLRPRWASGTFVPVSPYGPFWVRVWSVYGSWNHLCFCPVFHGEYQASTPWPFGFAYSLGVLEAVGLPTPVLMRIPE